MVHMALVARLPQQALRVCGEDRDGGGGHLLGNGRAEAVDDEVTRELRGGEQAQLELKKRPLEGATNLQEKLSKFGEIVKNITIFFDFLQILIKSAEFLNIFEKQVLF